MFRLAHISDVHLSPLPPINWTQLLNKRITGYLNWKLNRKHAIGADYLTPLLAHMKQAAPDHTVVTGDLVNLALPLELLRARDFLTELGSPEDISVICGNHDAYVPGALRRAISAWKPYLGSDETPIERKGDFPYLRTFGDVAIIGCNSADATAPFLATGYFRRRQAAKLGALLERTKDKCRIVMIHHPPIKGATNGFKRLIGVDRFQSTIRAYGADLVLHGHTHLANFNMIRGKDKPVPVIGVPAAGNNTGNLRPAGRYNLFDIEPGDEGWKINWQAFGVSPQSGQIEKLEDRALY